MEKIAIAVLGSGVLSTIINCIFTVIRENKASKKKEDKQIKDLKHGVQQLMYDRIKYLCKSHINRGHIATNDLEDLDRMHTIYHDELDGNGYLLELMEAVHELPIIPVMPQ